MPEVSVYLPDELYRSAREHELPISALAQQAIEAALIRTATNHWVERVRARPARFRGTIDTADLLDCVRDDFGR